MFFTIDLANAYHQVLLAEESKDIPGFRTHEGLFHFDQVFIRTVFIHYGCASSKLMSLVLKGLKRVQNFLHDLIVYGMDKEDNDCNLWFTGHII